MVSKIKNNEDILYRFISLYDDIRDNFSDRVEEMKAIIEKETKQRITNVTGSEDPFGIKFMCNGQYFSVELSLKGDKCKLDVKKIK